MRGALADTLVIARRNVRRFTRSPEYITFLTIQPIMFVVLFAYVFGGAIETPGFGYIDFLIPGILMQTIVFGATLTGVGMAEDMERGLIDRFRSLPMARLAVLAGRTVSDLLSNVFTTAVLLVAGVVIGFGFGGSVPQVVLGIALLLLFGYAFSWISALVGLSVSSAETAQSAGFIWVFPLTFGSSAFVPAKSMPAVFEAFAKINPCTLTTDAMRHLLLGAPAGADAVWQSALWSLGLIAVFAPLAVARFRRVTAR